MERHIIMQRCHDTVYVSGLSNCPVKLGMVALICPTLGIDDKLIKKIVFFSMDCMSVKHICGFARLP